MILVLLLTLSEFISFQTNFLTKNKLKLYIFVKNLNKKT